MPYINNTFFFLSSYFTYIYLLHLKKILLFIQDICFIMR